jgi:FkbM family methyltransferase
MPVGHSLNGNSRRDARPVLETDAASGAPGLFGRLAKRLLNKPATDPAEPASAPSAVPSAPVAGWADHHTENFMRRYLRPGDAVLDIGARDGTFAVAAAAAVGADGRVDSFEPSPSLRRKLTEAVHRNHAVAIVIHPKMVGTQAQLGRFVDGTGKSGRRRPPLPGELAMGGVIGVECVRLDQTMNARRYALMKLDIAGGELIALKGAEAMLREANPPALLIAMDDALNQCGTSPEQLTDFLTAQGYESILYDADRHKLDYIAKPWTKRRIVLAVAQKGRNFVSSRLAGMDLQKEPEAPSGEMLQITSI